MYHQPPLTTKVNTPPHGSYLIEGFELVGYHDLDARPGFKMAMKKVNGQWLLYMGHLWHRGWSVLDVTDPQTPDLIRFVDGPENTWTIQVQVADSILATSLEKIDDGWGGDETGPFEEGLILWTLDDPTAPEPIGRYETGGNGLHRNFFGGGNLIHVSAALDGYQGHIYQILDISDPARPSEIGRWWIKGQWIAGGESSVPESTGLHAPYIEGDRAFLAYGAGGLIILDIHDPTRPDLIAALPFAPPYNPTLGIHSVMPLNGRGLLAANSEAIAENCDEPFNFAGLIDVSDIEAPRVVSSFPVPVPPPESPYLSYCEMGGRFGPHNLHQHQNQAVLYKDSNTVFLTYFNAGLRVFDVSVATAPKERARFVPPDPPRRRGVLPRKLVTQSEDVIVDSRGYVYLTDKNHGLFILKMSERSR